MTTPNPIRIVAFVNHPANPKLSDTPNGSIVAATYTHNFTATRAELGIPETTPTDDVESLYLDSVIDFVERRHLDIYGPIAEDCVLRDEDIEIHFIL